MEPIKPCNTYHARSAGTHLLRMQDGKSAFKVYFVDIVGRKQPERFVWRLCGRKQKDFLDTLSQQGIEGVGFIIAFPHITKVFRYGPNPEIVLNVRAYKTETLEPLSLERSEGYMEFACLAEALIGADEYRFWAEATSVEDYFKKWSAFADGPIVDHEKLRRYWG